MNPQSLQKKSWIQDALKIASGAFFAQLLNALATPLLSRLYPPEIYGGFGTFISLSLILSTFICLRYDVAIVLPNKDEDAFDLLLGSLSFSLLMATIIGVTISFVTPKFSIRLIDAQAPGYQWLLAINLMGMGFFQAFNYWSTRHRRYWWLSLARIGAAVATIFIQVGLAIFQGSKVSGLIYGFIAGFLVSSIILLIPLWRADQSVCFRTISSRRFFSNLVRYRKFPLVDSWNAILNALSWNLVPLLIYWLFSSAQAGHYTMAYRLIQVPVALISVAVGQVFFQHSSRLKENENELIQTASSILRRLVALGLFPALLLTITGRDIFSVILGNAWEEAGIFVQILGIWLFFWFLSSPFSVLTSVMERQGLSVIIETINLACRVLSILIGSYFGNIYLALGLFAGSGIVVFSVYAWICLRLIHMPFNLILKPLAEFLPVTLFLSIILWIIQIRFHPSPIQMTIIGGITAVGYMAYTLQKGILKSLD